MTLYYTKDHEWLKVDDDGMTVTVGITSYAQAQLGDIVYVDLPPIGKRIERLQGAAVVESVKAASDVYAPISGTVTEINERLSDDPSVINSDPEGEGWFFRMRLSDLSEFDGLFQEDDYQKFVSDL